MIEETIRKLQQMRLYAMTEQIRQLIDTSRFESLSSTALLSFLVDAEFNKRNQSRIERLLRQASLKIPTACIADIKFSSKRNLIKDHLEQVLNGDFLKSHKNFMISGATGCGKTYLAVEAIELFIMNGVESAMNNINHQIFRNDDCGSGNW